jgi:hypothetical protein
MNQALYAHMNNKRKMKKKIIVAAEASVLCPSFMSTCHGVFELCLLYIPRSSVVPHLDPGHSGKDRGIASLLSTT